MTCNKNEEQLLGYLYAALPDDELEALRKHISSCRDCRDNMKRLEGVKELFKKWDSTEPSADLKKHILWEVEEELRLEKDKSSTNFSQSEIEYLRQRANSERLRIYKTLVNLFGREKGLEVYRSYLEESYKEISVYFKDKTVKEILLARACTERALGFDLEIIDIGGGVIEETFYSCPMISIAEKMGIKKDVCEIVCKIESEMMEKYSIMKVELLETLVEGSRCLFKITG